VFVEGGTPRLCHGTINDQSKSEAVSIFLQTFVLLSSQYRDGVLVSTRDQAGPMTGDITTTGQWRS